MTAQEIIAKRKRIWTKRQDIDYDAKYVEAVAQRILLDGGLRKEIQEKPYLLIEMTFTIVDKEQKTVPFFFNDVQTDIIAQIEKNGAGTPYYILKGRQQGCTSLITALQLAYAIVRRNFAGFTLADCTENSLTIFNDKAKAVYNRLPDALKPTEKYNSSKELYFDKLNSSWRIASATDKVGRSRTLNFLHMSEIAFYKSLSSLQKAIGEAVTKNAVVIYETTANGFNEAKDLWDNRSCINLFYEWWRTSEYVEEDLNWLNLENLKLKNAEIQWLNRRIAWLREKGIRDNQIAWYCRKYKGYLDKETIKQEYPCTPEEAFISSGHCYFGVDGKENIIERIEQIRDIEPLATGEFGYRYDGLKITDIYWIDDEQGPIRIYEHPKPNYPYVVGGDTAGEGSDYFIGQVLNNNTGSQVAVFRKQLGEELYARQIYCLGMHYNKALLSIEINFSSYPVKELARLSYPRLYLRPAEDKIGTILEKRYGFKTTTLTRPTALAELAKVIRECVYTINDTATLFEMLSFIKDANGKPVAEEGKNDDLVMALAIAHYSRPQQSYLVTEEKPKKKLKAIDRIKRGTFIDG